MKKVVGSRASDCLVDKYIGSAYDKVKKVADNIADVNTVVDNMADVNTVVDNIADVNVVAANMADVTNFADVYLGPRASDPSTRTDGSPLQTGDMYFNTTIGALRSFDGSTWRGVPNGTITVQNFSGDGIKTEFLLDCAPEDEVVTSVFISGVYQQKNTYGLGGAGGAWLIFDEAPPVGTDNIEVVVSTLQPSDDRLRQDLADPDKGAAMVARGVVAVDSIADLLALPESARREHLRYLVKGYYAVSEAGGGEFYWDAASTDASDDGFILGSGPSGRFKRVINGVATVDMFGAIPNVVESQSQVIQNAMNVCAGNGVRLVVDNLYYVSSYYWDIAGADAYCVKTPSNLDMHFTNTGKLQQFGSPHQQSSIILVVNCDNVKLWSPRVEGTRLTEPTTLPETNHGIKVLESTNTFIYRPNIKNTLGDGMYIGRTWVNGGRKEAATNLYVYEPVIDRVRRNGLSLCAWNNVTIVRPLVTNVRTIDGVDALAPRAGIDIEPEVSGWTYREHLITSNLRIIDPSFIDCDSPFDCYIQSHCKNMEITWEILGTMRLKGTGEHETFKIRNMGIDCSGRFHIDRVVDDTEINTAPGDIHYAATLQNNVGVASLGVLVTISEWEVVNQIYGAYHWVYKIYQPDINYQYRQGNISISNIKLNKGVSGALSYNVSKPDGTPYHLLTGVEMTIPPKRLDAGYPGIINLRGGVGVWTMEQKDNYFDALVVVTEGLGGGNIYGNRFIVNSTLPQHTAFDVTDYYGTLEFLYDSVNPPTYGFSIKGLQFGATNAVRATSTSSSIRIRRYIPGGDPVILQVSGEWSKMTI